MLLRRAGLTRHRWPMAFTYGSRRNGIPFVITNLAKQLIWPVLLTVRLGNGRPGTKILFGPAAAEKLYGDPTKAQPGFITKWVATGGESH